MRPGQHNKRGRSRNRRHSGGGGGGGGGGGNPLNRVYESNGPDVKVRGTAQTVADKYLQLGRDAQASGDIVMSESYYQHAEHYLRILAAAQAYNQQFQQQQNRRPNGEDGYEDDDGEYGGDGEGDEMQPASADRPAHQNAQPDSYQDGQPFEGDRQPGGQQNQQHFRSRERGDRYRPRFDHNRERQEQVRESEQPRQEDSQPRAEPPVEAEQPAGAGGSWEAPSFLKRTATNGTGGEPARTRYPRRTRRDSPETSESGPTTPGRGTPQAD